MLEKNELLNEILKLSASHQWVTNKLVLTVDVCDCADIMFCLIDNDLIEEDGIKMTLFDEYIEFDNFDKILEKYGCTIEEIHRVFY